MFKSLLIVQSYCQRMIHKTCFITTCKYQHCPIPWQKKNIYISVVLFGFSIFWKTAMMFMWCIVFQLVAIIKKKNWVAEDLFPLDNQMEASTKAAIYHFVPLKTQLNIVKPFKEAISPSPPPACNPQLQAECWLCETGDFLICSQGWPQSLTSHIPINMGLIIAMLLLPVNYSFTYSNHLSSILMIKVKPAPNTPSPPGRKVNELGAPTSSSMPYQS